jgi:hypothetical protein
MDTPVLDQGLPKTAPILLRFGVRYVGGSTRVDERMYARAAGELWWYVHRLISGLLVAGRE